MDFSSPLPPTTQVTLWGQLQRVVQLQPKNCALTSLMLSIAGPAVTYVGSALPQSVRYLGGSALTLAGLTGCYLLGDEYRRAPYPASHPKTAHMFAEGKITEDGSILGELKYVGNIPVLSVHTDDPRVRGQVIAHATWKRSVEMFRDYIAFLPTAIQVKVGPLFSDPMAIMRSEVKRLNVTCPWWLQKELEGFISVYNAMLKADDAPYWFKSTPLTFDDLFAILCVGDVFKGIGCSAAVRNDGNKAELLRNLDWLSLGTLGPNSLLVTHPTTHGEASKPQKILSVSYPPCIFGMSLANDHGLVICLNEATTMKSKRNLENGTGQLVLIRELAEHCSTIDQVLAYLHDHPAAASHLLTVMDAEGKGAVIQLLPTGSDDKYTVRWMDRQRKGYIHTTNHFFDDDEKIIPGSQGFDCSERRYCAMETPLQEGAPWIDVIKSVNEWDTIQSMRFYYDEDGNLKLSLNFDALYCANNGDFEDIDVTELLK